MSSVKNPHASFLHGWGNHKKSSGITPEDRLLTAIFGQETEEKPVTIHTPTEYELQKAADDAAFYAAIAASRAEDAAKAQLLIDAVNRINKTIETIGKDGFKYQNTPICERIHGFHLKNGFVKANNPHVRGLAGLHRVVSLHTAHTSDDALEDAIADIFGINED